MKKDNNLMYYDEFLREIKDINIIHNEIKLITFKRHELLNKEHLLLQKYEAYSKSFIKSVASEILTKDFTDKERKFLTFRGVDKKFKDFNLLEALIIRSNHFNLSYLLGKKTYMINTHLPITRSKMRSIVSDPYDDVITKVFFKDLNNIVSDNFRFRIREYRQHKKSFAIDIIFNNCE